MDYFFEKVQIELSNRDEFSSKIDWIKQERSKLSNLIVIRVAIGSEADAYDIFETTNARGVDLSVSDLLKNLIFKHMPAKKDKDLAKEIWKEISINIEATDTELKRFIRYYWLSKHLFISEKNLYREIRNKTSDWESFLDGLWTDSDNWRLLNNGTKEEFKQKIKKDGGKFYKSVLAINLMNVSQCKVFLLSILRNYDNLHTNPL